MEESGQMELGVGMFVEKRNGVGKERNEMGKMGGNRMAPTMGIG